MKREQTIKTLEQHNAWRRGGGGVQTNPTLYGQAIETAIAMLRADEATEELLNGYDELNAGKGAVMGVCELINDGDTDAAIQQLCDAVGIVNSYACKGCGHINTSVTDRTCAECGIQTLVMVKKAKEVPA